MGEHGPEEFFHETRSPDQGNAPGPYPRLASFAPKIIRASTDPYQRIQPRIAPKQSPPQHCPRLADLSFPFPTPITAQNGPPGHEIPVNCTPTNPLAILTTLLCPNIATMQQQQQQPSFADSRRPSESSSGSSTPREHSPARKSRGRKPRDLPLRCAVCSREQKVNGPHLFSCRYTVNSANIESLRLHFRRPLIQEGRLCNTCYRDHHLTIKPPRDPILEHFKLFQLGSVAPFLSPPSHHILPQSILIPQPQPQPPPPLPPQIDQFHPPVIPSLEPQIELAPPSIVFPLSHPATPTLDRRTSEDSGVAASAIESPPSLPPLSAPDSPRELRQSAFVTVAPKVKGTTLR